MLNLLILFFLLGLIAFAIMTDWYAPKLFEQTFSIQKATLEEYKQMIAINLYVNKSLSSKKMLVEVSQSYSVNSIPIYNNDMIQQH